MEIGSATESGERLSIAINRVEQAIQVQEQEKVEAEMVEGGPSKSEETLTGVEMEKRCE